MTDPENYAQRALRIMREELINQDSVSSAEHPGFRSAFALLAIAKGAETTLEDIHNAWALIRVADRPTHRDIVPFGQLDAETISYDQKYQLAVHAAAERMAQPSAPLFTATGREVKGIPQREETGVALLRAIWEDIKADTSAWNQSVWIGREIGNRFSVLDPSVETFMRENKTVPWDCGTACCLAGHTVLSKGYKIPSNSVNDLIDGGMSGSVQYVVPADKTDSNVYNPWDYGLFVADIARELLDLSHVQSGVLFDTHRRPYEIECIVDALESDPNAHLLDVCQSINVVVARSWEAAHGFRDSDGQPTYTANEKDDFRFFYQLAEYESRPGDESPWRGDDSF